MASKKLINLSNLQKFLLKLNEKFALKKTMKGISEDFWGNIIIGEEGLVPTPNENSKGKFLRSDGEWALPSETAVYDSMTIEEGVAGVSEVDKVLNAKNLKQIVNSDGFLTSLDSSKLTGIINIENLPQGALERILIVSSKEERLTLSDTEVQLGDVVKESDTGLMYYVINTEKLNSEEGYTQFTAGMASSVPWSGVTNKPLIPTKTSDLTNDSDFAINSNVVHRSGDEYINGTKMFSNTIHRFADLTTSSYEQVYRFDDTNANACGHIYNNVHWHNNAVYNRHGAYNAKSGKCLELDLITNNLGRGTAYISGTVTDLGNLTDATHRIDERALATMGWVNNPATSTNVVHRSGDETIDGNKVFTNIIHRYADLTTSGGVQVYRFVDSNANSCGHIFNNAHWAVDTIINSLGAYNAKSGKTTEIHIVSNDAGGGMAYVEGTASKGNLETVTSETGHTGIATMGWVNNPATSTNVVHRSGDETINGAKTFTYDIRKKNNALDLQVNPSATQYNSILFTDKNNAVMGYLEHLQTTTGVNALGLIARDKNNGSHGIQITSEDNVIPLGNGVVNLGLSGSKWKNVYSTNDITNKVITYSVTNHNNTSSMTVCGGSSWDTGSTLFLYGNSHYKYPGAFNLTAKNTTNDEIKLIGYPDGRLTWGEKNLITTEFVKGTNYWYRKHSDGFIEMGGFTNCEDKPGLVVETNLPIAFSNTNYTLSVQLTRGAGSDYILQTTSYKSTTFFEVCVNDVGSPGSKRGGFDWYACGY